MNYVYIYLNPLNKGKYSYPNGLSFDYEPFYVGVGVNNRYKMHIYESNLKKSTKKVSTIKEIKSSGQLPIIKKIYENLTPDEATSLEIDIIKNIGRLDLNKGPLTNLTNGGDSVGYKHKRGDLLKLFTPILCYNKNMEFIKEYPSISEASEELNIKRSNISQCCRHLIKISHNKYVFRYKDQNKDSFYSNKNEIYRIMRIDYNGNKKLYKRMRDASKETGISINSITKSCKGRILVGGDYLWRYTDVNKNFYEKIENRYGFNISEKIIDSFGNIYRNSLQASIETKYKLYTICQNLIGNYNLKNISFKYS